MKYIREIKNINNSNTSLFTEVTEEDAFNEISPYPKVEVHSFTHSGDYYGSFGCVYKTQVSATYQIPENIN
jgi:hypothetical protein